MHVFRFQDLQAWVVLCAHASLVDADVQIPRIILQVEAGSILALIRIQIKPPRSVQNHGRYSMKILFIAPKYTGGNGMHVMRIYRNLARHGFEVSLFRAPHIPIKNIKNPSFAIFGAIKALANTNSYDIVHAFNVPSAFAMRCIRAKKRVLSIHGVFSDQIGMIHSSMPDRLVALAESRAIRWADKLATDSEASRRRYMEKLGIDFECTISPLDPEEFIDIPNIQKKRQVVYVGRDSYEKGIDILRGVEEKIDADVVYCTNLSWQDAMLKLKESSVLVIPSRVESMPQVIIEAFYLRVPVVATDVGGVSEILTNGKNGLLIPPEDPKRLVDSVNRLLNEEDLACFLADAGYRYAMKNLTWDTMLPRYVQFYEDLLAEP